MSNYFIIDQINPHTGEFDEHKIVAGANLNTVDAALAYLSNYEPNWKGLGAISEATPHIFDLWLKHGNRKAPFSNSDFAEKPLHLALVSDAAPDPSKSRHWITTETGSHILINGNGEVIAGAGGKLAGKKFSVPAGSKDVSKHIETVEKIAQAGYEKHGGDKAEYLRLGTKKGSSSHFAREYERTGNIPEGHLSAALKTTKERINDGELKPYQSEAFKEILKNPSLQEYYKDDLENHFQQRAIDIYNDLLTKGWKKGERYGELEKGDYSLSLSASARGVSNTLVDKNKKEWIDTEQDSEKDFVDKSPSEFANMIDSHIPEGHLREALNEKQTTESVFTKKEQAAHDLLQSTNNEYKAKIKNNQTVVDFDNVNYRQGRELKLMGFKPDYENRQWVATLNGAKKIAESDAESARRESWDAENAKKRAEIEAWENAKKAQENAEKDEKIKQELAANPLPTAKASQSVQDAIIKNNLQNKIALLGNIVGNTDWYKQANSDSKASAANVLGDLKRAMKDSGLDVPDSNIEVFRKFRIEAANKNLDENLKFLPGKNISDTSSYRFFRALFDPSVTNNKVTITGGSDKQNKWASDIINQHLFDMKMNNEKPEEIERQKNIFSKATAKQVIDFQNHKDDLRRILEK